MSSNEDHDEDMCVSVDRKLLESLIKGELLSTNYPMSEHYCNADAFFNHVTDVTGCSIRWPQKLKFGAKSKKDPYVRISGTTSMKKLAHRMIVDMIGGSKLNRVALKLSVPFNEHAHIIGRGGRNTQNIVKTTSCHIHFPDAKKHKTADKADQVSIEGTIDQVESARLQLRQLAPITIEVDATIIDNNNSIEAAVVDIRHKLGSLTDLSIDVHRLNNTIRCRIRASIYQQALIVDACNAIRYCLYPNITDIVCIDFNTTLDLFTNDHDVSCQYPHLQSIAEQTRVIAHHRDHHQRRCSIQLFGLIEDILHARQLILGFLPIQLSFEVVHADLDESDDKIAKAIQLYRQSATIFVINNNNSKYKKRPNDAIGRKMIVVRSLENRLKTVYDIRELLIGDNQHNSITTQLNRPIVGIDCNNLFEPRSSLHASNVLSHHQMRQYDFVHNSSTTIPSSSIAINPDPNHSPIAHSVLTGAKNIEQKLNCRTDWKTPGNGRPDRRVLLIKASQAMNEPPGSQRLRTPTDHWSGFGFSKTSPAELLKQNLRSIYNNHQQQQQSFIADQLPSLLEHDDDDDDDDD